MFKLTFLTFFLNLVYSYDHLLEGASSIGINEEEFNSRKKNHPKILLLIWDKSRDEVVADLMKWKKIVSALPSDVLTLHYERNEHNKITERILPKAFPAYIYIEDEHYAYEFHHSTGDVEDVVEFANGKYKNYPKEHIPHQYDPKKKYKKSWFKLLVLLLFINLTLLGICCCFKFKNKIEDEDEDEDKRKRHYKKE